MCIVRFNTHLFRIEVFEGSESVLRNCVFDLYIVKLLLY